MFGLIVHSVADWADTRARGALTVSVAIRMSVFMDLFHAVAGFSCCLDYCAHHIFTNAEYAGNFLFGCSF